MQVGSDLVIDLDLNGEFNVETDVTIVNFFSAEISSSFSLVGNLTGTEIIENFAITIIEGTPEDDVLEGTAGNDAIDGGPGNDIIISGGIGNSTLIGGAGIDTISFVSATVGFDIDLFAGVAVDIDANFTNSISGFEAIIGSDFDDTITVGADAGITLQGGLGDDVYELNATNAAGCLIEDTGGINSLILEGVTIS